MSKIYRKNIDWELFQKLCEIQCTQSEIASMLKVDRDTLRDRAVENYGEDYSAVYKKFSESGMCSLRRNQFVLSKKNAAMAIWLGKLWLGQRDPSDEVDKQKALENQTLIDRLVRSVDDLHRSSNMDSISNNSEQKSACETGE